MSKVCQTAMLHGRALIMSAKSTVSECNKVACKRSFGTVKLLAQLPSLTSHAADMLICCSFTQLGPPHHLLETSDP